MNPLKFQQKAIEELSLQFKELWATQQDGMRELVFKSPTGSGKTFMVSQFVSAMNHPPDWDFDKAWVWITFSDDLAMQSKNKFFDYFFPNLGNRLLTVADFSQGRLYRNDILFLNWQKLVSRKAADRRLRRPDEEAFFKESGYYFEDIAENTRAEGREFVMIIDESHKNVTEAAFRDVIEPLNPRLLLKVSATPEKIPSAEEQKKGRAGFVCVERESVVEEGLIKEKIVCQTEEDLQKYQGENLDEVLLQLAIGKKNELQKEYRRLRRNVNPLVLIQLPNDDKKLLDQNVPTKEQVVLQYLKNKGVSENRIACWFDGRREKMEFIEENDSPVDFMLFKQAAGTGWDCPRAHILVMYREIQSPQFHEQVLGRILRMPEPWEKNVYTHSPLLRTGYLFTNYQRNEVQVPDPMENKAFCFTTENRLGESFLLHEAIQSEILPRVDYGDLGDVIAFRKSMSASFDRYFGLDESVTGLDWRKRLEYRGIDLRPQLSHKMIVNAEFENFDNIQTEMLKKGKDADFEISPNDVEKIFTFLCSELLREQTEEEAKIGNVARSWGPFKSMLRGWLKKTLGEGDDYCYRVFIKDIRKNASSQFRPAITQAFKEYRPILNENRQKRQKAIEERLAEPFYILKEYAFTEDYERIPTKRCLLKDFYIRKSYSGRKNELAFVEFLDNWEETLEWWFKNGDSGKDFFALRYWDTTDEKERLFYPDWILKFHSGVIGFFDTKQGQTASSRQTKDKAETLQKWLKEVNRKVGKTLVIGGIVVPENGQWYYHAGEEYHYQIGKLSDGWKPFAEIRSLTAAVKD